MERYYHGSVRAYLLLAITLLASEPFAGAQKSRFRCGPMAETWLHTIHVIGNSAAPDRAEM